MGEQLGRPSRGTKPEKCDHSKFGGAPSAMKRDTDPATVRLGPGTGMATGNYQFLRTAKGWKIVRRGSEPAAPRAMDDALPPAADVNSRAAPVAKLTTTSATAPVTASKLSKEAATRKIDAMIEEFYSNFDPAEAGADFKDLGDGEYHSQAISAILEKVSEKKRNDYIKTADLLVHLAKNDIVTADVIVACLTRHVEAIEDISVDVPEIFKNVAILLSRLLYTGAIRLSQIPLICSGIIDSPARIPPAPKLLGETLYETKKEYGPDTYNTLIKAITSSGNEAGFDLRELFPGNKRSDVVATEFLEKFVK
ncbi:hypothetical protein SeLEV6574_g08438 [Synchytrium endobioticum]|uniref:MI domain-containing protein n=1 Tax=Synchytrium endobioticum TaxID=286115 RepID=A0A507C053_9FUNG|nr:hypothetical protein SeLEV6574_g08438 [Synchytrium endobioticum]